MLKKLENSCVLDRIHTKKYFFLKVLAFILVQHVFICYSFKEKVNKRRMRRKNKRCAEGKGAQTLLKI